MPQGPPPPSGYVSIPDYIREEALKAEIPPELALAVAEHESSFNPTAVNPTAVKGEHATGTFQFLPSVAKARGIDPNDPVQNIQGGVKYLRELLDKHNWDPEATLREYGGVRTDTTYVPGVLARVPKFQQQGTATTPAPQATAQRTTTPPQSPSSAPITPAIGHTPPTPYRRLASAKTGGTVPDVSGGPPEPSMARKVVQGAAENLDPRTRLGRRNLAGMAAGTAAAYATGGLSTIPSIMAGTLAAGAGGAAEDIGEQVAGGARNPMTDIELGSVARAGAEQGALELAGRAISWPAVAMGRKLVAPAVSTYAAKSIEASKAATEAELAKALKATDAMLGTRKAEAAAGVEAVRSRLDMRAPAVSAKEAGRMAERTISGPAKSTLDRLGESVEAAAGTGPAIPTAPLKERLKELSEQIIPMAGHEQTGAKQIDAAYQKALGTSAGHLSTEEKSRTLQRLNVPVQLPETHPLPAVLGKVQAALADTEEISFSDAHRLKRILDETVTWDKTSKRQVEQATKGFRGTLRDLMSTHEPYGEATSRYAEAVQPFRKGLAPKLVRLAQEDPNVLVRNINPEKPVQVEYIRDLLLNTAAESGGKEQGLEAWNAVRAAWTYRKLAQGGADKLLERINKLDPDFVAAMYGDTEGKTILTNLKNIGQAFHDAEARGVQQVAEAKAAKDAAKEAVAAGKAPTQDEIRFAASTVHKPMPIDEILANGLRAMALGPTSIWGGLSTVRLLGRAPTVADLVYWSARSPASTRLLVDLAKSPAPGLLLPTLLRSTGLFDKDRMMASHGPTPPPKPASLAR